MSQGMLINLYKLYFFFLLFLFSTKQKSIHESFYFSIIQPNTHKGKLNFFYPSTFLSLNYHILSSHFLILNQIKL